MEIKPEGPNLGMLPALEARDVQKRLWAALGVVLAMAFGLPSDRPTDGPLVLSAQEGHPLSGTWAGEWVGSGGQRTHLTVVMAWDGKAVTGLVNPGPDAIPLTQVVVDWATWTL